MHIIRISLSKKSYCFDNKFYTKPVYWRFSTFYLSTSVIPIDIIIYWCLDTYVRGLFILEEVVLSILPLTFVQIALDLSPSMCKYASFWHHLPKEVCCRCHQHLTSWWAGLIGSPQPTAQKDCHCLLCLCPKY